MIVRALDWLNRRGKGWACRIVHLTGQAPVPTHPKHLWDAPWNDWYLDGIGASDCVLDLGCGTGAHANRAHGRRAVVAAMDIGHRPAGLSGRVYYAAGDAAKEIPWPDGFFTVILALDVLEHVEDRQGMLQEIRRVLTHAGRLYLAVPCDGTTWRRRLWEAGLDTRQDPDHKIEYRDLHEVAEELRAGGFVWITAEPIVYDTPWAGLLDCLGALCPPFYRAQARWKRRRALAHPEESTGFAVVARPA